MRRPTPSDDTFARALRGALGCAPDAAAGAHPSDGRLAAYLAHELDEGALDELERHLASCAACTDELVAAVAVEDEVRAQAARISDVPAAPAARTQPAASTAPASRFDAARRLAGATRIPRVKRRRSWLRIAASVTIVFGALVVAAAAGSRVLLARLEPVLVDGMASVLGRKVSGGDAAIVLAGGPGLRMNGIDIAEDPQFGSGSFAQVRSAKLQLDPGALLRGNVRGAVHLDEPVVHLLRDVSGRWNVESLSGKGLASSALGDGVTISGKAPAPSDQNERMVRLTSASVEDGVLEINDRTGSGRDVTLRNVDARYANADPRKPATISFASTVGSETQRIALRGEIGPFEGGAAPRYRFDEVILQSLPLADIPGAPADLSGELTFKGTLASEGSGFDTVMMNASGDGDLGLCCGELRELNLTAELLAALTQHTDGDAAAAAADVLARARKSPALAAVLALDATPFEDISGAVALAGGSVTFEGLAVETSLFQASAMGSVSRAGAIEAVGTLALTPAATAAIVALLPEAQRLFGAGAKLEVPFSIAGNWPDVAVRVDVHTAIARWVAPLDPRSLVLLRHVAG